jgi:hypothetical protein
MLKGARASTRPATVAGGRLVTSTRRAVCRRDAVDRPSDTHPDAAKADFEVSWRKWLE